MTKLTKKQKIQLAMENQKNEPEDVQTKVPGIFTIIKQNYVIILSLILLCVGVYFNSLDNQLTLVDDIQSIVYDDTIKSFDKALKTTNIQKIFYAVSYYFFEYNPLPIRIASVFLHTSITVMVFIFLYLIFGKKHATVASLIFAVHPINTEAVSWISANPYLNISYFMIITFLFYLYYKKTNKKLYLYISALVFILSLILVKAPWVLITPIALMIVDQFFIEKKINYTSLWWIFLFTIPISIYLVTYFTGEYQARIEYRAGDGNRITLNAQSLKPVIEGYPYTIFLMSKLYLFPKDLTVYYDGTRITSTFYVSMYIGLILYIFLTFYLWKKDRILAGIFIIMPVLISPTLSPIKVTWFLAERYLYSGTIFFALLVSLLLEKIQKKFKVSQKIIWVVLGVILVIYATRTIYRNNDWQDTESLSFATMKTSPLSVRPYNDVGGHYYYKGEMKKAMEYYERGLEIVPSSGTAVSNLGYIYLEQGPLIFMTDYYKKFEYNPEKAKIYFDNAIKQAETTSDQKVISFFINQAVAYQPDSVYYLLNLGNFYQSGNMDLIAKNIYERVLEIDPDNEQAKMKLETI